MNNDLKKILISGISLLMLSSIGASTNIIATNNIHASRISRLVAQRNKLYQQSSKIKHQITRINAEIKHLNRHHKEFSHKISSKRINVNSLTKYQEHAYRTGLSDGGHAANDDGWYDYINIPIVHRHLLSNKYYDIGYYVAYIDNDQDNQYGKNTYSIRKYSTKQLRNIEHYAQSLGHNAINQNNSNVKK